MESEVKMNKQVDKKDHSTKCVLLKSPGTFCSRCSSTQEVVALQEVSLSHSLLSLFFFFFFFGVNLQVLKFGEIAVFPVVTGQEQKFH